MILKNNEKYIIKINQSTINQQPIYASKSIDWSFFDKIYCIHYLPYKERYENIKNELIDLGILDLPQFEWYYTVDNKYYNNIVGNNTSENVNYENINYSINMLNLYKICLLNNYKHVLFIEDDIHVADAQKLITYIQHQPNDADYIQYEYFCLQKIDVKSEMFIDVSQLSYKHHKIYDAGFLYMSRRAIEHCVKSMEHKLNSIDNIQFDSTIKRYIINDKNLIVQNNYLNKQCTNSIQNLKYGKFNNCNNDNDYYKIALVCIAKDEDKYIDEWISYHLKLGFSKIFIYANNWNYHSNNSNVIIIQWNNKLNLNNSLPCMPQVDAYNDFINRNYYVYDFAMILDCDEFLTLKNSTNISDFIKQHKLYEQFAVSFQWRIFGDNGLRSTNDDFSVLKRFTKCSKTLDKQFKTLINLSKTCKNYIFFDPHQGELDSQLINVDILGNKIIWKDGNYSDNKDEMLNIGYISHFRTKTYEEFKDKCLRNNTGDFRYDYEKCPYHNTSPIFMQNDDFNQWNINEIFDYTSYNFMFDKNPKYVEVKLSGRLGNIILEIASAFIFCKKYNIPYNSIVVNKHYDFINLANELVAKNYLENNIEFLKHIPYIKFIDMDNDECIPDMRLAVESGNMIEISLSNNKTNDLRYESINFGDFQYIRINSFYQNSQYKQEYKEIMKLWMDVSPELIDRTKANDFISYSIRLGDFKRFLPNLVKSNEEIQNDVNNLLKQFPQKTIRIFSDNINEAKNILKQFSHRIEFFDSKSCNNDFEIFQNMFLSDKVFGNMYSTFAYSARMMNSIFKQTDIDVYWQPELEN